MSLPNLDGMSPTELDAFWVRYRYAAGKTAGELIGDRRRGFTNLARRAATYAINKAIAMRARARGNISAATMYEGVCDQIYQSLPEDIRW